MKVKLTSNWYAPDGRLYPKSPKGVEVPDKFEKQLPSKATILERSAPPKAATTKKE